MRSASFWILPSLYCNIVLNVCQLQEIDWSRIFSFKNLSLICCNLLYFFVHNSNIFIVYMLNKVTLFVTWCDIDKTPLRSVLHCVYSYFFKVTRICTNYKSGDEFCVFFYSSHPLNWYCMNVKFLVYPF